MRPDFTMAIKTPSDPKDNAHAPRIEAGGSADRRWWKVGSDRVELARAATGWTARVLRAGWGGVPLDVDGHFGEEAEAVAWCHRMALVLAHDLADEASEAGPA